MNKRVMGIVKFKNIITKNINNKEVRDLVAEFIGKRVFDNTTTMSILHDIEIMNESMNDDDFNVYVRKLIKIAGPKYISDIEIDKGSNNKNIDTKAIEACLNNVQMFLEHNVKAGHLKKESTIADAIHFIKNIRGRYIPVVEDINEYVNNVLDK